MRKRAYLWLPVTPGPCVQAWAAQLLMWLAQTLSSPSRQAQKQQLAVHSKQQQLIALREAELAASKRKLQALELLCRTLQVRRSIKRNTVGMALAGWLVRCLRHAARRSR